MPLLLQSAGEEETSQDGMQSQDRKALRKAKNRASAAASRARREAYTASLEDEVTLLPAQKGIDHLGVIPSYIT